MAFQSSPAPATFTTTKKRKKPKAQSFCQRLALDLDKDDRHRLRSRRAEHNNQKSPLIRLPAELRQEMLCHVLDDETLLLRDTYLLRAQMNGLPLVRRTVRKDVAEVTKRWRKCRVVLLRDYPIISQRDDDSDSDSLFEEPMRVVRTPSPSLAQLVGIYAKHANSGYILAQQYHDKRRAENESKIEKRCFCKEGSCGAPEQYADAGAVRGATVIRESEVEESGWEWAKGRAKTERRIRWELRQAEQLWLEDTAKKALAK